MDASSNKGSNEHSEYVIVAAMAEEEIHDREDVISKARPSVREPMEGTSQMRLYIIDATRASVKPKTGNLGDATCLRYFLTLRNQDTAIRMKTAKNIQLIMATARPAVSPLKSQVPAIASKTKAPPTLGAIWLDVARKKGESELDYG